MTSTFAAPTSEQRALWDAVMDSCRADDLGRIGDWVREHLQGRVVDLNFRLQPGEPCLLACVLAELIQQAQIAHRPGMRPTVCERVLATLIAHGANPLDDPETLDMADREQGFSYLAEALSSRETQGRPLRASNGGNLYHALAIRAPWRVADYANAWGLDQHYLGWLRERDDEGFTPLERAIVSLPDLEQRVSIVRAWIGVQQFAAFAWRSDPDCLERIGPDGASLGEQLQTLQERAQAQAPEIGWLAGEDCRQAIASSHARRMTATMEQETAPAAAPMRAPRL